MARDMKTWINRFELARVASMEARRLRPRLTPDESLTRALELMELARECGVKSPEGVPEEDLRMYQMWARLSEPYKNR